MHYNLQIPHYSNHVNTWLINSHVLFRMDWVIDYRIYDPDHDGKTKLDHVRDMLNQIVDHKQLSFHAVLMDTW